MEYTFKTKPYKHQLDCWHISRDREFFAILAEMGTGKSKMLIDTLAWLRFNGKIDGVLIIAPKGVYKNWVNKEIPEHMPDTVAHDVAAWVADAKRSDLLAMRKLTDSRNLRILVMNVEALQTKRGYAVARDFLLSCRASLIAVDESTIIKNPKAVRTKACLNLSRLAQYKRILSGEPAANSPLDLYSQFEFLKRGILGFTSFVVFRQTFARLVEESTAGGRKYTYVAGYRDLQRLQALISPHSFIIKKKDCLDLPEKIYTTCHVEMSDKQRKAYESMRQRAIVELSELETLDSVPEQHSLSFAELQEASPVMSTEPVKQITANIVITQLLRLHQIVCGFMRTDDGEEIVFEDNPRMEALLDTCRASTEKVIIWATYKRSLRDIAAQLRKEFGDKSTVSYHGETSNEERTAAIKLFQDPSSEVRFFVGNPQTAGYGLTLTEAGTVIYYANSYDSEKRLQSEDRAHRIGQSKNVVYVDLIAESTVDEKIVRVLREKKKMMQIITPSNWREWI